MSSGVKIAEDVKEKYQLVKTGKKNPYVIYKIADDLKNIVVDKLGEEGETFEDFRQHMLAAAESGQGRYAVYDLVKDDASKNKTGDLVFIVWISDDKCGIKQKMLYSSSKDAIKKACVGFKKELQCNDESELTLKELNEKMK
ncbi:actophorin-like [Ruditapes philippinarum]|uniref:actophorin-like n=1 Tax=Ruditapes philippinarum TaxID=129788 RepID=UPI00295A5AA5|nr:actophorin-like [Ruditapes philippinarum]